MDDSLPKGAFKNYVDKWFFKCQSYWMSLFSKHINWSYLGGQDRGENCQRSFWMPPKHIALKVWSTEYSFEVSVKILLSTPVQKVGQKNIPSSLSDLKAI